MAAVAVDSFLMTYAAPCSVWIMSERRKKDDPLVLIMSKSSYLLIQANTS